MNPNPFVSVTHTPVAANVTALLAAATGAGPWFSGTPATGDDLGHRVTIASIANLSAINFTVVGTDANGNVVAEVVAGPNNNSVATVRHFKTMTGLSASATLGVNTINVGFGASAATAWILLDYQCASFGISCALGLVSGTINYDLEHTYDVPNGAELSWTSGTGGKTATGDTYMTTPVRAVRVHVNSFTSAVFKHYVFANSRA